MANIIAGIGSRETPFGIMEQMMEVGNWCRQRQVYLRSGHAPGADQAFEKGAQEYCIAYLPWLSFEVESFNGMTHYKVPSDWDLLIHHAKQYHPYWKKLSQGAQKLMARNSAQVLGLTLKSPVKAVVCWTRDGGASGGTGQAIRIANANQIPVLNMHSQSYCIAALVIQELYQLFGDTIPK